MLIGIDASRAAKRERTGVEEYTYQVIKHLAEIDSANRYILYTNQPLPEELTKNLSANFRVRQIPFFRFWTQYRLPRELKRDKPDVVWLPASALPASYRGRTVVTIHGLEFEYFPEAYSTCQRWYLRWSTRRAVERASKIIAVSNNTKRDLMKIYGAPPGLIEVVPNGYSRYQPLADSVPLLKKCGLKPREFFIFTGRLEIRKNIKRLIAAYADLRRRSGWPGKLVLAGGLGFGGSEIKEAAEQSAFRKDIIFSGFLTKPELATLTQQASALVYPSLYEGFGLPILEAFSVDTPVVCSRVASMPEVGGEAVIYVSPADERDIRRGLEAVLKEPREKRQEERRRQLGKFGWDICARGVKRVLTGE